jgi:Putative adhesin
MRAELPLAGVAALALGGKLCAQAPADAQLLAARAVEPTVAIKAWNPAGSMRFVSWDKDSVVVRGVLAPAERLMLDGSGSAMKLRVEGPASDQEAASHLVAYVPRRSTVSVKTVSADIVADGVSGWFFTVSGSMRLSGHATSIEAESISGSLDLDVTTAWIKARTGAGGLRLRGEPQSVDASTISGALSIATSSLLRGEFSSVSGDIQYAGTPAPAAIVEFSDHSGSVDLSLPRDASAALTLSTIAGRIENGLPSVRTTGWTPTSMRFELGRGEAQLMVRTFRGPIRLRQGMQN